MTIDRYIYVAHPFENISWRKPKTVFFLSLIIWLRKFSLFSISMKCSVLVSCILATPFYSQYGLGDAGYQKQCVLTTDEHLQLPFRIYTVTLYYFIPLIIIVLCYTRLLSFVYTKENKIKQRPVMMFFEKYFLRLISFFIRGPMQLNGRKNAVR